MDRLGGFFLVAIYRLKQLVPACIKKCIFLSLPLRDSNAPKGSNAPKHLLMAGRVASALVSTWDPKVPP